MLVVTSLFIVCGSLFVACWLLNVGCYVVVHCLLFVVCWLLLLFGVRCCSLFVVSCSSLVWLLLVVG